MIISFLEKHIDWSQKTFGHGVKTESICRHIEKELNEIREKPHDLEEWIDVVILAFDGAWRAGYSPLQIIEGLKSKQEINFLRKWQQPENADDPIEHVREDDENKR